MLISAAPHLKTGKPSKEACHDLLIQTGTPVCVAATMFKQCLHVNAIVSVFYRQLIAHVAELLHL